MREGDGRCAAWFQDGRAPQHIRSAGQPRRIRARGRYRFGNYGVVAFVDAGQVYEAQYPTFDSMRFGVGIGGRVYTNFGPVRVDVATPIGRRQGETLINVYVSIGQAF